MKRYRAIRRPAIPFDNIAVPSRMDAIKYLPSSNKLSSSKQKQERNKNWIVYRQVSK